jgi:chaperonin GroEL
VALLRAQEALTDVKVEGGRALGIEIVRRAIEEPLRQIVSNAGGEPSVVVSRVREGKDDFGFNALTGSYEALFKTGVIDPTKVVRSALQNAASVAGLLITTEAAIATKPEKKAAAPAAGGEDYDDDY